MQLVDNLAAPTRILIVDDDASVRDVISVLLQEEGYECRTASSAETALDIAAAEAPPLVISDMKMPGRDGIWLLEAFRERYPETAVIMLTGYGDTEAAVSAYRSRKASSSQMPSRPGIFMSLITSGGASAAAMSSAASAELAVRHSYPSS